MEKRGNRLAIGLMWLGALWLVAWPLYVTFGPERVSSSRDTMVNLAVLLIPAAIAFAVSWALGRLVKFATVED